MTAPLSAFQASISYPIALTHFRSITKILLFFSNLNCSSCHTPMYSLFFFSSLFYLFAFVLCCSPCHLWSIRPPFFLSCRRASAGEVAAVGAAGLQRVLGDEDGWRAWQKANGIDKDPVTARSAPKSIGCSKTFPGKAKLK